MTQHHEAAYSNRQQRQPSQRPVVQAAPRADDVKVLGVCIGMALLLLAGLLHARHASAGEVYKWMDKDGHANYSDQPPPGQQTYRTPLKRELPRDDASAQPAATSADGAPTAQIDGATAPTGATPATSATAAPGPGTAAAPASGAAQPGPAGSRTAPATTAATSPSGKDARPQSMSERELEFRKRRIEANESREKQAKLESDKARRTELCSRERSHLQSLRDGVRVVRYNDKGEQVFIDDEERARELKATEERLETSCK